MKTEKILVIAITFLLIIPLANAQMLINITLTDNNLAYEDFSANFISEKEYAYFDYAITEKPLSVEFDGEYELLEKENYYVLRFHKEIIKGENSVQFSLIQESLVEKTRSGNVFRSAYKSNIPVEIFLTLPTGYFISEEPSIYPKADQVMTDGQRITLHWKNLNNPDIIVFYQKSGNSYLLIILLIIILLVAATYLFFWNKSKNKKIINDLIGEDEKLILEKIKSGITKQKDISKELNFSKSKMSKVVRKLEEKNLIESSPHFKTNILKIKK